MSLTALVALAAFLAGLGMAVFRHPIYGLYTYVAVFYVHPPSRWWGEALPDMRWAMVSAAVTFLLTLRLPKDPNRTPWFRTAPAIFLMAYTTWLWIQLPWALDPEVHRAAAVLFTKFIVVYYMLYRLLDSTDRILEFSLLHLAGCFYLGWIAWGMPVSGRLDGVGGPGIDDSNTLGMHVGTAAVLGAMLVLALKGWRRALCVAALMFILNTLVLTGSRGAFLALVLGGFALVFLKPPEHRKAFWAFAIAGMFAFGYVASDKFWERMGTLKAAVDDRVQMDNSAEGRLEQITAGLEMFSGNPFGIGHRGYAVLSPHYLAEEFLSSYGDRASHNTLLTTLVEQGIPGFVMYLALIFWIMRTMREVRRGPPGPETSLQIALRAGVQGGLVCALVAGMFADFLKVEIMVWLTALLAIMMDLRRRAAAGQTAAPQRTFPLRRGPLPRSATVRRGAVEPRSGSASQSGSPPPS